MTAVASPRYRFVALDLDGTTLNPRGQVAPRTKSAIHALREAGVYVCFATGRNLTESRPVLEAADHYPNAVFVGGASVVDTAANSRQGALIRSFPMHPDLARELSRELEGLGQAVLALQETFAAGFDYLITEGIPLNKETLRWTSLTKASLRYHPSLATYEHPLTLRVGIVAPPEAVAQANLVLETKYNAGKPNSRIVTHTIAVPPQGVEVVEIFDPQVTKWSGIRFLADSMGIAPEEIIAVGDDLNDLPMLRHAGLGVAMGNAHPLAKQAAKLTINTHAEDGLAQFLESLLAEGKLAAA